MDSYFRNNSQKKIKVSIKSSYNLIDSYLKVLLEDDRDMQVLDISATEDELLEKIKGNKADVILISLLDNEGQNLSFLKTLFAVAPNSKVVILNSPNSSLDQTEALKLGVTGIVGTNQSPRVLIRAIKQVSEGDVWLNQKLIAKLLGNNSDNKNSNNNGYHSDDELTSREIEVVELIARGLKNKAISDKLYISEATVRHHLSSIYSKLNIDDRLNLAIYAFQKGMNESRVAAA